MGYVWGKCGEFKGKLMVVDGFWWFWGIEFGDGMGSS